MQVVHIQSILTLCLWRNKKKKMQCKWYLIWTKKKKKEGENLWISAIQAVRWCEVTAVWDWLLLVAPVGNSQHINPLLLLPHAPPIQIVFLFILGNKYCPVYFKIPFFTPVFWRLKGKSPVLMTNVSQLSRQWQLIQQKIVQLASAP